LNKVIITLITLLLVISWKHSIRHNNIQIESQLYRKHSVFCTKSSVLMRCREIMVTCYINLLIPIGSMEKMRTFVYYIRGTCVSSLCFKRLMRAVIFVGGSVRKLLFPSLFLQSHHTYRTSILVFAWQLCNTSFNALCK